MNNIKSRYIKEKRKIFTFSLFLIFFLCFIFSFRNFTFTSSIETNNHNKKTKENIDLITYNQEISDNDLASFYDPKIVRSEKIHDSDSDKIGNSLEALINGEIKNSPQTANTVVEGGEKVKVIIGVEKKPDDVLINKLINYGAEICSIHDKLIYAVSVILPIDSIPFIATDPEVTLIEKAAYYTTYLDTSTINMGVRGSPYVWEGNPTIKGNPDYSIAILDTGVDSTHPDLGNLIWFEDFTNDSYPNGTIGFDLNHHGTHCASIAAGTGVSDSNPDTTRETISSCFLSNVARYKLTHWFQIKDNSNNPNTIITLHWDSGVGAAYFLLADSNENYLTPARTYTSSPAVINMGKLAAGWYQVIVAPTADTLDREYTITIEHESDYSLNGELPSTPVFSGVAPRSNIVSLKVLSDNGSGDIDWFLKALAWISSNGKDPAYNITTVSISLGFDRINAYIDTSINNLVDEGFICVAAAGNDGTYSGSINSPGTAKKVITVGAVNDAFEVASYSSNGDNIFNKPDVLAPGGTFAYNGSSSLHNQIIAADSNNGEWNTTMLDQVPNNYRGMQGTSMSTPHVAGLAQLAIDAIIQTEGTWTWSKENALRVKQLICMGTWEVNAGETFDWDGGKNSPDGIPQNPPLNRIGRDIVEGFGMVRADAVIQAITHPTKIPLINEEFYLDRRSGFHAKDPKVLLFRFYAVEGHSYDFSLNVPSTGDFDLLLYDDDYDPSTGTPIIAISSNRIGLDTDESLIFTPSENGTYYWSIRAVEGYGNCQISINTSPDEATNPNPMDGATDITTINPKLSVNVSDPDGDVLDIYFYDNTGILIGIVKNISSGETASVYWSPLYGSLFWEWYVIVSDGISNSTSPIWNFTIINFPPKIGNDQVPDDGSTGVSLNPTLSIRIFDTNRDFLNISFYNADDNNLIKKVLNIQPTRAPISITWASLSENTTYKWYVVVSDGITSITSPIWNFTTGNLEPPKILFSSKTCYILGTSDTQISWTIMDDDPPLGDKQKGYELYQDRILVQSSFIWSSGEIINYNIENLSPGVHNITIIVWDQFGNQVSLTELIYLLAEDQGDVNDDGYIDIKDALHIAQYYVGIVDPTLIIERGDVDADGSITIFDALYIARYYVFG